MQLQRNEHTFFALTVRRVESFGSHAKLVWQMLFEQLQPLSGTRSLVPRLLARPQCPHGSVSLSIA